MKQVILIFIFSLTLYAAAFAQSNMTDSVTITTYYPAPYGVYRNLKLNPSTKPAGNAVSEGVLYYDKNDHMLRYKNVTDWVNVTGGGSSGGGNLFCSDVYSSNGFTSQKWAYCPAGTVPVYCGVPTGNACNPVYETYGCHIQCAVNFGPELMGRCCKIVP